jgi:molybdopterin-containing oxidoreductase family iron-sulfur binding subunit
MSSLSSPSAASPAKPAEKPEFWRSLSERAGEAASPQEGPPAPDAVSRRGFMKLMGASVALAGLTSCIKQPLEPIVPYVRQPDDLVLGVPMYYATAMTLNGYAYPQLVTSHEGRPTKTEGNPQHPMCLGGSDIFSQASILTLYDPDRAQTHLCRGEVQSWLNFVGAMRGQVAAQQATQGAGFRILTPSVSSSALAWQLRALLEAFPQAKWHQWEPWNRDHVRAGARLAFGQHVETRYNLLDADVILCLDAEIFAAHYPGNHLYARQYASRRRADPSFVAAADVLGNALPSRPMNRLYALESTPGMTGAKADHCLRLPPSEVERYARIIATRLGIPAGGGQPRNEQEARWIDALVRDLQLQEGSSVVIAGDEQPPAVHVLAHAINERLGNAGSTVIYTDPVHQAPTDQTASIQELAADMAAGKVDLLLMTDVNPVYDAPADLEFAHALQKVAGTIYHGLYLNETAAACEWFLSGAHYLESWSDACALDGTASIVQPLIAPLYNGKSFHEVLNAFTTTPEKSGYDTVRGYWRAQFRGGDADFESWWRQGVHDGFIAGTALVPRTVKIQGSVPDQAPASGSGIEVAIRPDPSVYDGRFANNGWLQELPKPMSKLTWDNAVLVGPEMAKRMGLSGGDLVEIQSREGRKITGAVWIQAGQPDNAVTVHLGYGRSRAGRTGSGMGFNVYPLRTTAAPYFLAGVQLRKAGGSYSLVSTQGQQNMENRHLVRAATLADFQADPNFAHAGGFEPAGPETLYPQVEYTGYAWAMSIDLNKCVGCNACIVACQAENNIAVVGKEEVGRGRHMHWLRVDSYYQGDAANPQVYFQPVPCQQCENAPCELVCPVDATVHSTEGLNDMVYNRCVGTRYCSNNCPYKVRRFNFFLFQDWTTPQMKMARNPEVSVRSRGVMEKCTYCVQRLTKARIQSEEEDRLVRDNEVLTACQQACPANAIVFGNLSDKESRVARLRRQPLNYGLLADLNTRPRTTYQAVVRNVNKAAG